MKQECIPVGCVPPATVAICWGVSASVHAKCGPGDPQAWAWRPPWVWAGDPTPGQTPQLPPWVWAWRPPWTDPSSSPMGVGLETCKACWYTTPWRPARHAGILPARHAGIPPPANRITDMCKNITLPQLRCGR